MNAPQCAQRFLTRLPLAAALLLILFVPSSIGTAQTVGPFNRTMDPSFVYCGPGCCHSDCYTGTWYYPISICVRGGNGSCIACDTTCG